MDIMRCILLHDWNLLQFYSLGILANTLEMMDSKNKVFMRIYGLN